MSVSLVEPPDLPDDYGAQLTASGETRITSRSLGTWFELDALIREPVAAYDWLIPGLLERGDRLVLTAEEGAGKSTLLRQMGVQMSCGIHPFGGDDYRSLSVVHVEAENSKRQVKRALTGLRAAAGERYGCPNPVTGNIGNFETLLCPDGLTLTEPSHEAWLTTELGGMSQVDVLIIGPLYKVMGGDPVKEEPALLTASALDRIRNRFGCALLMEAHSPKKSGQASKRQIEPYGASLWLRWPEFGYHLTRDGAWLPWRGDRDVREWPTRLRRGEPWPWMPADPTEPDWDGPQNCMDDVVAMLESAAGTTYTGAQLLSGMRSLGHGYRDRTVREAAERLALEGRIEVRNGARNSRIYTANPAQIGDAGVF